MRVRRDSGIGNVNDIDLSTPCWSRQNVWIERCSFDTQHHYHNEHYGNEVQLKKGQLF